MSRSTRADTGLQVGDSATKSDAGAYPGKLPVVFLILSILLFLSLGGYQLHLPGLHYDEAKEAGLNAMQPLTTFRDAAVQLGPIQLPLMVQDYIGSLNVLAAAPFLAIGGINVVSLRWLPLLIGALTLVLTWRVAGLLGGPVAASLAALLLAVNPSFVFWSRQGVFVTNLTALFLVASLLAALHWWQEGRSRDLWLTAFLWGLGLYSKLLFAWAIVAMVVVAAVAWAINRRAGRLTPLARLSATDCLIAVGCLAVPLAPLVVFNLRTGGTIASLYGNLGRSYYGVNNAAYWPNLQVRLGQIVSLVRGDHFWYLGEIFSNLWAPFLAGGLAAAALLYGGIRLARGGDLPPELRRRLNGLLMSLGLIALIVLQSAFTVSDLFITHYVLLLPLISLSGGLAASVLWTGWHASVRPGEKRFQRALALVLLMGAILWWAGGDLWTTLNYHQVLAISGGAGSHSDAINNMARFLACSSAPSKACLQGDGVPLSAPVALDWGMDAPLRFLTAGHVNPVEVFGYTHLDAPDEAFLTRIEPFLANPDNVYIAHAPEQTVFRGRVEALVGLAAAQGLSLREIAHFNERSGRPLFLVYRVAR